MLQLFSAFAAVQMNSITNYFCTNYFLPSETPSINFNMDPYCEGCVPQNFSSNANSCPLSGRITINAEMVSDPAVRTFLNGQSPQISVNLDAIQRLVNNVIRGNYPKELLYDSELPYITLGAYVGGKLSVEEASFLLISHQETKDFPDRIIRIESIFKKTLPTCKSEFKSEEQLSLMLKDLTSDQKDVLRDELLKLPISQQVIRILYPAGIFINAGEFSLEAHRVLTEVRTGHPAFDQKPQLGDFSKEQIVRTEIEKGKRLRYTPMAGVEASTTVMGLKVSHSSFSAHDRLHMDILNRYSPKLVNALREIMAVLINKTKRVSNGIWRIGDFDYTQEAYSPNLNTALAGVLKRYLTDDEQLIASSHILANQDRWKKDYEISAEVALIMGASSGINIKRAC